MAVTQLTTATTLNLSPGRKEAAGKNIKWKRRLLGLLRKELGKPKNASGMTQGRIRSTYPADPFQAGRGKGGNGNENSNTKNRTG